MESREKDVLHVWDFWNECNIVKHRDLSKFSGVIKGRLNFYTVSELCEAIRNYKDILVSERHWFTYTWTLDQFLSRKNALDNFIDRETALNRYRRCKTIFDSEQEEEDGADFYRAINKEQFNCPEDR